MADEFVRTTFARYRLGGGSALLVSPAWLRVLGPLGGAPQILDPIAQQQQAVSAQIAVASGYDVRVDDILNEDVSGVAGRTFIVKQIEPLVSRQNLLHCSEIRPPIPDEFQAQSLESFWVNFGTYSIDSEGTEGIIILPSMPDGTSPVDSVQYIQHVSGDFDVWARLRTDAGSVGNVRNALLGCQHPSELRGTFVGVRDNGTTADVIRYDVYTFPGLSLSTVNAVSASPATYYYMRLKRSGQRFRTFYKISPGEPIFESEWIEVPNDPALSFSSFDELRIGLFAFTNNSNAGEARFAFLRNWIPDQSSSEQASTFPALRCIWRDFTTARNVGGGLQNLHSFTLDAGKLANNGDYLRVRYSGSFAGNDNDKRINVSFGGQNVQSDTVVDIDGGSWVIDILYARVSATSVLTSYNQSLGSLLIASGSAVDGGRTAFFKPVTILLPVSDLNANAQTLLVQGEGTNNNDVVQNMSIIELCQQ